MKYYLIVYVIPPPSFQLDKPHGACHNFNFNCQQEPQTSHLTSSRGRLEQAQYWCDLNTNKEGSKDEDYFLNSTLIASLTNSSVLTKEMSGRLYK